MSRNNRMEGMVSLVTGGTDGIGKETVTMLAMVCNVAMCIVYCVLCIVYCVLCIMYYVLCIMYCVLCIVWCDVMWCDVMWTWMWMCAVCCVCCVVVLWCDVVWCGVMWCDVVWCDVMCFSPLCCVPQSGSAVVFTGRNEAKGLALQDALRSNGVWSWWLSLCGCVAVWLCDCVIDWQWRWVEL